MDRKAFTLIEVLAVILLLGIVLGIIVPNILSVIQKNADNVFKIKEGEIKKAASDYVLTNSITLPTVAGEVYLISFDTLINADAIKEVYDTDGDTKCNGYVHVIKKTGSGYDYTACIFCQKYETDNLVCDIDNL